jgi:hypothetical protein
MLNCGERVDWKSCSTGVEEETVETKEFRTAFKPFDVTRKK